MYVFVCAFDSVTKAEIHNKMASLTDERLKEMEEEMNRYIWMQIAVNTPENGCL